MNVPDLFKSRDEFDLTSGDVGKPLFYLSLPIVVTNLLQTAYNLADTFWIGQYSTDALAAISFAFPMVFLIISLGMGLAVAGSILVAQYTGADDPSAAEYAASQTVGFAAVASVLLGALAYTFVGDVLDLLGAAPDVLPLATAYMEIISLGIFFMFGFFVFISLMRGYGDTITPMLVMLGSVALNVALDPFLIFGWWIFPQWGIEGAAIATVFSRGLALVVGLWIMVSGRRGVRIRPSDVIPDLGYGWRLVRIGVPASIEGTGQAIAINLLMFIVGTFSTPVVAAFGIGVRVFSVIFLPAIAVSRGVETMSGQNIGAGKPDRAALAAGVAARTTFVVLAAAGVVTFVFADPIVGLFTTDQSVVDVGANFLRYVAPSFGFIGIMRSYNGGFRGAGKTLTAAAIAVSMLGLVRLPIAWVASRFMGPPGIWVSFFISNIVGAVLAYAWFQRGTWRSATPETPTTATADDVADD
ncbi:putative efflux protein, MATE family [Haloplanus vescus]|uniref:Multidrug-efflux transporter n=1 Tax=Haloplanus vescus TaxID=555874 RepID=A0A1H3YLT0_9EURY|nr:MATE family efflux transporter [Haloplanus vescus]SEA12347.1 putative efflux protein, MATE family [Haloplanus vescus]